jgi:hypothetical protein
MEQGLPITVSPHYYYATTIHRGTFGGALEKVMHNIRMFDRKGPNTPKQYEGSGADFSRLIQSVHFNGKTMIASTHKVYCLETNEPVL